MPPRGCLPNPCPLGAVDSRVICSIGAGRVAAARVLPGLLELSPSKDLAGGVRFVPFALRGLGLGVILVLLSFGLTLAHLPCLAWCGGARGSDCPCTGKGVQRCAPSFVHRHTSSSSRKKSPLLSLSRVLEPKPADFDLFARSSISETILGDCCLVCDSIICPISFSFICLYFE